MTDDRTSDLTSIDAFIDGPKKEPWPPVEPQPGITFRRIQTGQNSFARTKLHRDSELVPYVEDERAFYRNCQSSRLRETRAGECGACKGARFMAFVRVGEFGRMVATGKVGICPRCSGSGSSRGE